MDIFLPEETPLISVLPPFRGLTPKQKNLLDHFLKGFVAQGGKKGSRISCSRLKNKGKI